MQESHDEKQADVYYDAQIQRLKTRAKIKRRAPGTVNARECWMERFFADRGRLAKLGSDTWCLGNEQSTISLAVTDNGVDGDGLALTVNLEDTGSIEEFLSAPDDGPLMTLWLTPRQARMLFKALEAVCSLRECDSDE